MAASEPTSDSKPAIETFISGCNLMTPHGPQSYPGFRVIRPGNWEQYLLVGQEGMGFVALGGERVYAYATVDGGHAQAFLLRAGDHATLTRNGLDYGLAEWQVQRSAGLARE